MDRNKCYNTQEEFMTIGRALASFIFNYSRKLMNKLEYHYKTHSQLEEVQYMSGEPFDITVFSLGLIERNSL